MLGEMVNYLVLEKLSGVEVGQTNFLRDLGVGFTGVLLCLQEVCNEILLDCRMIAHPSVPGVNGNDQHLGPRSAHQVSKKQDLRELTLSPRNRGHGHRLV